MKDSKQDLNLNILTNTEPTAEEFSVFKRKVSSLIGGLDLASYKNTQMERRIKTLMLRTNVDNLEDYYNLLKKDSGHLNDFINMLTINVTEFFRNPEKFALLQTEYIPELLERNTRLKIWSSGCSIGAEIYSIAMILDKMDVLDKCTLVASDFDENVINKAKSGIYTKYDLKDLPEKYKKYFKALDDSKEKFQIDKKLASKVVFRKQDLLNGGFEKGFDLICCRNVVIYLTDEAKYKLYENFYKSLKPGGILFIGSTEIINKYKEIGFNLRSSFFYQK